MKKTLRFGIIGGGLMGKEFASAAARWCHLTGDLPTPEIVGVCSLLQQDLDWFSSHFSTVKYLTKDYQDLLEKKEIDVIYCAVPHHLHQKIYCDIIRSGKHMLGEKPFGIDKAANDEILKACAENPKVLVRCASEFPYFPACQQLIRSLKCAVIFATAATWILKNRLIGNVRLNSTVNTAVWETWVFILNMCLSG